MLHPSVTIRTFAAHDVEPVLALNNASVPELNELDAAEVARLAALAEAALVAEVDGSFAGFCWVIGPAQPYASLNYGWFSRQYDEFVYLDRIAVHPHFRRYGIGRVSTTRWWCSSAGRGRCCSARSTCARATMPRCTSTTRSGFARSASKTPMAAPRR